MKYSSTKESYSEVYELIRFLGDEYKDKIPKKLYEFIESNRDKEYKPKFDKADLESLNEQSISRKAIAIMAFLNLNYWVEDEKEKEKLEKIYTLDQQRFEDEVVETYHDELVCNGGPDLDTEETTLPEIYKEKWYQKLLRKIIDLFNRVISKKK